MVFVVRRGFWHLPVQWFEPFGSHRFPIWNYFTISIFRQLTVNFCRGAFGVNIYCFWIESAPKNETFCSQFSEKWSKTDFYLFLRPVWLWKFVYGATEGRFVVLSKLFKIFNLKSFELLHLSCLYWYYFFW